jgi:cell wall-associated NlpC family hydrolase
VGRHGKKRNSGGALRILLLIAAVLGLALLLRGRLAPRKESADAPGSEAAQTAATPAPEQQPQKKPSIFAPTPEPTPEPTPDPAPSDLGAAIVATAKQYLGVRYVYGGASPSGFDCSGFTMYVFARHGIHLSHRATWQLSAGTAVSRSDLRQGDLVFFNDPAYGGSSTTASHVGIYIGGGQFIHCSSNGGVKISSLTGYFDTYYMAARRVTG